MRFILYVFTWFIVYGTVSALFQADWQNLLTGLLLAVPMVWWSKVVRDKRRKKLGITTNPSKVTASGSKLKRSIQAAKIEWNRVPVLSGEETRRPVDDFDSAQAEDVVTVERPAEVALESQASQRTNEPDSEELGVQRQAAERGAIESGTPTFTAPETESSSTVLDAGDEATVEPETVETDDDPEPMSKLWRDANGKILHVGSRVSFLAKSKGQSVSIPGLLLGEREGKALIGVQGGTLLPANEYLIPWNVVSYRA